MEIRNSNARPTARSFPRAEPVVPKTAAEMKAEWERGVAAQERERQLGGCPPELAAFAAGLCALSYHPFATIDSLLRETGASDFQSFDYGGSQAVAFAREGRNWIIFRGSESFPETEMFLDWGHDLLCLPWGWPPRHFGFARAWAKLRAPIFAWLSSRTNGHPLVLAGHSLGGALALAAADEIAGVACIEAVITFGAPRVGTWPWTARYHRRAAVGAKSLREVTWRIQNEGDIVTYVPPLLFAHCGRAVSASRLQAKRVALYASVFPSGRAASAAPSFLERIRLGVRGAKQVLPYSPLTLLFDLPFAVIATAPEHFMVHYGPAFPDRPFADLGRPPRPARAFADRILCPLKWMILATLLAGYVIAGWLTYRLSPEISLALLLATVVYAIAGWAPPAAEQMNLHQLPRIPPPVGGGDVVGSVGRPKE